tara:strand:+ start:1537 stop:2427 length:891 start_codon:yes stop_codon:yes gene_type:complete
MQTKIGWSRTRRDLFLKCPRAWFLRYGHQSKANSSKPAFSKRRPWDLMLRATKEILIERLEELREGKQWSNLLVEHQLKHCLQEHLHKSNCNVESRYFTALLRYSSHRMNLLWRCRIIQQLVSKQHACWYVLDRTDSVTHKNRQFYSSPDVAILIQKKWHLVRFDMQSAAKNLIDELEANAMVLWAKQKHGFPQRVLSYRLHTIGWRRGFWMTETYQPTLQTVKDSKRLLESDCRAMETMFEYGQFNLGFLPLATSRKTCHSCSYRTHCPASKGLARARQEQKLLELAHSSQSSKT